MKKHKEIETRIHELIKEEEKRTLRKSFDILFPEIEKEDDLYTKLENFFSGPGTYSLYDEMIYLMKKKKLSAREGERLEEVIRGYKNFLTNTNSYTEH